MPPIKGTRRTSILARRSGSKALLGFWLKRVGFVTLGLAVVGGASLYAINSGYVDQSERRLSSRFHLGMATSGFGLENIMIEGRNNFDKAKMRQIIGMEKGQSIFEADLEKIKEQLELEPWVETATVERYLPNVLYVHISERKPIALWQHRGAVAVIDKTGKVLTRDNIGHFRDLMILVGEEAPTGAYELVGMVEAEPELKARIESAKWIGGRRWDLYLKNGVTIKLPEDDFGAALRRLAKVQDEAGLMDRHVESIDLRDGSRIIVKTIPGDAEEYQAAYTPQKYIGRGRQ